MSTNSKDMESFSFEMRSSFTVSLDDIIMESLIQSYECEILATEDFYDYKQVGKIVGWLVPQYIGEESVNVIDAADGISGEVCDFVSAVMEPDTNEFRKELNLDSFGNGILILNGVALLPEFRGHGIGLAATWHAIQWLGRGCSVVVLRAHPMPDGDDEFIGYDLPKLVDLSDAEIVASAERLARYWERFGFKDVPGRPYYMYRDMAWKSSPMPEIGKKSREA